MRRPSETSGPISREAPCISYCPSPSILALALVSQGVVQTFGAYETADDDTTDHVTTNRSWMRAGNRYWMNRDSQKRSLQRQPNRSLRSDLRLLRSRSSNWAPTVVASSMSILLIRLRIRRRSPISFELLAILLIPAALCYTFGMMVGDTRQGWALLAAMTVISDRLASAGTVGRTRGQSCHDRDRSRSSTQAAGRPGGNMEGKETRFGMVNSVLWAAATTAASNGSVNSMHDSYTPLGGLVPLFLMQFGEVVFGGVGSGLYGMIVFAIIAVFIAGLMVGQNTGISGKENRALRNEDGLAAHLDHAHHRVGVHGDRGRDRRQGPHPDSILAPMGSARSCTPTLLRETTTAARSRVSMPILPFTTSPVASRC